MKYFILGDEDAVLGFGLAGVRGRIVENQAQAEAAFTDAIKEKELGILIITEKTADLIRPLVDRYIFTETFPLILEIPDRTGRITGKPGLRTMVNRSIGINL